MSCKYLTKKVSGLLSETEYLLHAISTEAENTGAWPLHQTLSLAIDSFKSTYTGSKPLSQQWIEEENEHVSVDPHHRAT